MHWAVLRSNQHINVVHCLISDTFQNCNCVKKIKFLFFLFIIFWEINNAGVLATNNEKTIETPFFCNGSGTIQISSVVAMKGFITSANYPFQYPSNHHCIFELSAPIASELIIHLAFIDIDLKGQYSKSGQCLRDYVRFMITGN